MTVTRWGGDGTSRYNYKTDFTNSASDYYFENFASGGSMLQRSGSTSFPQ